MATMSSYCGLFTSNLDLHSCDTEYAPYWHTSVPYTLHPVPVQTLRPAPAHEVSIGDPNYWPKMGPPRTGHSSPVGFMGRPILSKDTSSSRSILARL